MAISLKPAHLKRYKDIAWLLGIDDDVMNEDVRLAEVRNWIDRLVLPTMRQ